MRDFEENIDFVHGSMYDEENTSNGGGMMTAKEILAAALKDLGMTQAEAARECGQTPQQLSGKLGRNSLRADEFLEIMDAIGIDIEYRVRSNGKKVRARATGYGRRVRGMVDRVTYDTAASEVLANNFWADGVNEYNDGKALELYIDKENRYFFAEYSSWEGVKDRICPVSASDAAAFIEKYGTEIFRKHQ